MTDDWDEYMATTDAKRREQGWRYYWLYYRRIQLTARVRVRLTWLASSALGFIVMGAQKLCRHPICQIVQVRGVGMHDDLPLRYGELCQFCGRLELAEENENAE